MPPDREGLATKQDLRDLAISLSGAIASAEARTGERIDGRCDGIDKRLDTLNSKTATHGEAIAAMGAHQENVDNEVFHRMRRELDEQRRALDQQRIDHEARRVAIAQAIATPAPLAPIAVAAPPAPVVGDWKQVALGVAAIGGAVWAGVETLFRINDWLHKIGFRL